MKPSLTPELRNNLVVAYLGHRLNNHELVDLLRRGQSSDGDFDDTFTAYANRDTDWRGQVSDQQVSEALEGLGLGEQFRNLDENKVWSSQDRALYRRLSQPAHDPPTDPPRGEAVPLDARLVEITEEAFNSWNRDSGILLERHELDFLLSGGYYGEKLGEANDPEKAAVLATLLRYQSLLEGGDPNDGPGGISMADLVAWTRDPRLIESGAMAAVNEVYQEYRERAEAITQGRSLLEESVEGANIHQGVVGSCVLLSTIAGSPAERLREMFPEAASGLAEERFAGATLTPAGSAEGGTHTVRFADGAVEKVAEPSLAARLHHSQGKDGERWPAILEIAAAQRLLEERRASGSSLASDGLRSGIEGIDPEFAIPALTGKSADKRSLDEITLAQTREVLAEALAPRGPVICGSRPTANGDFINEEELHNGIANGHCYRIKSYDATTDTVQLQNPWHKGEWMFAQDGSNDGVFEMPLKDFYASFRWVTFPKR